MSVLCSHCRADDLTFVGSLGTCRSCGKMTKSQARDRLLAALVRFAQRTGVAKITSAVVADALMNDLDVASAAVDDFRAMVPKHQFAILAIDAQARFSWGR